MLIKALTKIVHDGVPRFTGTEFEVSDADGADLIAMRMAQRVSRHAEPRSQTSEPRPSKRTYTRRDLRAQT